MSEVQKHVWLNGNEFPIKGFIDEFNVNPWQPSFDTGEKKVSTHRPLDSWVIGPLQGGMGKEKWEEPNRYWYAENVDCSREYMTLGPLVSTKGTFGVAANKLIYSQTKVWAIGDEQISYWGGSSWTSAEPSGGLSDPTDACVYYDSTNGECLVVGSAADGIYETHDAGSNWTQIESSDASYLAEFENRLCAVANSNTGFFYSADGDIATAWTEQSGYPLLPSAATKLITAKDPNDDPILYVITNQGMWALDVYDNFYQYKTEFQWARDSTAGKAALYAKGCIYVPAGGTRLLKIDGGVVTEWGPDDDDGLIENHQGNIVDMTIAGYWVIIAIDGGGGASAKSSILKRHITKGKWHCVYTTAATARLHSLCWDDGTLWFGEDTNVKSLPLSSKTDNYKHLSTHTYSASGDLYTEWFSSPFEDMTKTAHELWCKSEDMNYAQKVNAYYRRDDDDSWTALGTFNLSPKDTRLPFGANNKGVTFERIQFKFSFARGSTTTNSPKVERFTFKYRVNPPYLEGWTFRVPLEDDETYGMGETLISRLKTAAATETLLEFYPRGKIKGETAKYVEVQSLLIRDRDTSRGQFGEAVVRVGEVVS